MNLRKLIRHGIPCLLGLLALSAPVAVQAASIGAIIGGPASRLYVEEAGGGGGAWYTFDRYIGPSGSDSNDGLTPSTPWALTAINTKRAIYAGTTVGLLDGTYNVVSIAGQPPDTSWHANHLGIAAGSSGARTIIAAVNPPSGGVWNVILDGQRASYSAGNAENGIIGPLYSGGSSASYVTIDGLEIKGANYEAVAAHDGGDFFVLQNSYLHDQIYETTGGANSATVSLAGAANATIRNNLFEDGGAPGNSYRHDFILTYDGSDDLIVEYNTIQNVGDGGNGVYVKSAGTPSRRSTIRWNVIDRSGSTGVENPFGILMTGTGVASEDEKIYGNLIHGGPGRPPISLIAAGVDGIVHVYNNTLLGTWNEDGGDNLCVGPPATVHHYNNIYSRTSSGFNGDVCIDASSTLGTFDNNLYDSSPTLNLRRESTYYTTLGSWQSITGKEANSQVTSDPQFVGTGAFEDFYKLQSGSPAKTMSATGGEIGAHGDSGQDQYGIGMKFERVAP